jgi:hypothetical protein
MTDRAMQDDVGNDLFSAWWEGTNESVVRDDDGSIVQVRTIDEMFKGGGDGSRRFRNRIAPSRH